MPAPGLKPKPCYASAWPKTQTLACQAWLRERVVTVCQARLRDDPCPVPLPLVDGRVHRGCSRLQQRSAEYR